jgi:hypothetical protein
MLVQPGEEAAIDYLRKIGVKLGKLLQRIAEPDDLRIFRDRRSERI